MPLFARKFSNVGSLWMQAFLGRCNRSRSAPVNESIRALLFLTAACPHGISITDSSIEAVQYLVGYLYGVDVFKDGDLLVEEALASANLFLKFDVDAAAIEAARYCLQRSKPGHLNKLCCALQKVSEARPELSEQIAINLGCVEMSLLDMSPKALGTSGFIFFAPRRQKYTCRGAKSVRSL